MGADHVPIHNPGGPSRIEERELLPSLISFKTTTDLSIAQAVEDDEEAQLKELQASMAM